jgi:hypothetical protein
MRPLRSLLLCALVVAAAGVVPLRAMATEPAPTVTNLGLALGWQSATALGGGDVVFTVPEADQGGRDLNGDGDAADVVVHVWQASSGKVTNLGVALSGVYGGLGMFVPLDGGGTAFAVPEAAQGGRDLNGDGDATDSVVHRWTSAGGLLNLRAAVKFQTVCCDTDKYELSPVAGGDVAFLMPEADQGGVDRNGDGDAADTVATLWDHASGQLRSLGAARQVKGLANGHVAVVTTEGQEGVDLNGDGDKKDGVAQVWQRAAGFVNLKQAVFGVVPFGSRLALLVSEADQKAADRNGDGDADDSVIAVWDPADPGTVQNLGLAEGKLGSNVVALERGHLAFRGYETSQGVDLNGDGDLFDEVVHIFDPATKRVTNLRQNATDFVALDGGGLAFESSHLMVWSPSTNKVTDLGVHNNGIAQALPGGRVAFGLAEFGALKQDLNGDGDKTDHYIIHVWDPATNRIVSFGRVGEGVPLTGGGFAFGVSEPSEGFDVAGNGNGDDPGRDFDGDGDGSDAVLHVWDGAHITNLGRAGTPFRTLEGNRYAAEVIESQANRDLNGDGDLGDRVLQIGTGGPSAPFSGGDPVPPDPGPVPPDSGPPFPGDGTGQDGVQDMTDPTINGPRDGGPGPAAGSAARRSGYWMLARDGSAYPFGAAAALGSAPVGTAAAVDLEPTPSGKGYWIVDELGRVFSFGDAPSLGRGDAGQLGSGERVTSLSATPSGRGYWLFTTKGRVLAFGDARHFGDMAGTTLNGPVIDSIPTPSGNGYYMVGSDGGIFSFGDATFRGSMGGHRLNAPVQSLVPDGDGTGYWLVASDGGIFAFDAGFRGSMGGQRLNRPVSGMVPFGDGYLMVAEDGGIFNFSSSPFLGSLGDHPPATPVTAVAALG